MKPSLKERLDTFERFFFRLHFHKTITGNQKAVEALLTAAHYWVEAQANVKTENDRKEAITLAFERLRAATSI